MITPISFKGIQIGHELKSYMSENKDKNDLTGLYQVANFLDENEEFDFKFKKPYPDSVQICAYNKENGRKFAETKVSIKKFFTDPVYVVGEVGKMLFYGSKIGKDVYIDEFNYSEKSDDDGIISKAKICSDYHDRT